MLFMSLCFAFYILFLKSLSHCKIAVCQVYYKWVTTRKNKNLRTGWSFVLNESRSSRSICILDSKQKCITNDCDRNVLVMWSDGFFFFKTLKNVSNWVILFSFCDLSFVQDFLSTNSCLIKYVLSGWSNDWGYFGKLMRITNHQEILKLIIE